MKRVPSSISKTTTGKLPLVVTLAGIFVLVVVGLWAILAFVGEREGEPTELRPVDLGEGHRYQPETLRRFARLMESPDWAVTDPPRNAQGMVTAAHRPAGLTFVLIPAGDFMMGSPEDEEGRNEDEGPIHKVQVNAFLFCSTECTQRAWVKGGGTNRSKHTREDLPVETVTWAECRDWCSRQGLRLPVEAEWEYACRAGTRTRFWFGDKDSDLPRFAWCFINSGSRELPSDTKWGDEYLSGALRHETHAVGLKDANPWGLHDVCGNVWEWCEGEPLCYEFGEPVLILTDHAGSRAMRGGGLCESQSQYRSAARGYWRPDHRFDLLGFRPAADLPEVK